jgi:hypothetical protein
MTRGWKLAVPRAFLRALGRRLAGPRTFQFNGRTFPYYSHPDWADTERVDRWIETTWDEVTGTRYGSPWPCAHAIAIGSFLRL